MLHWAYCNFRNETDWKSVILKKSEIFEMEICNFLYEESVICEMKVLFVKREAVRKIPSAGKVWIEISYTSNNAKIVFF